MSVLGHQITENSCLFHEAKVSVHDTVSLAAGAKERGNQPVSQRVDPVQEVLSDSRGLDLRHRNFDGMTLNQIDFSGADLRGVNLSDCVVQGCHFSGADFVDACLVGSSFIGCDFSHARFGSTMIDAAHFQGCRFSGPSGLMLPWTGDQLGADNLWIGQDGFGVPMQMPIIILTGLPDCGVIAVVRGRPVCL